MDLNKGIKAMFIIEVLGRPPEHLKETLDNISKQIDSEQGIRVTEKKIHEPKEIEKQKGFYSNFMEIEVETEDIFKITLILFKYMPAHLEIIEPELISLTNNGWNDFLNELSTKLHGYDEITKIAQLQKNMIEKRLKEVLSEKQETEKIEKTNKNNKKKTSKKKTKN